MNPLISHSNIFINKIKLLVCLLGIVLVVGVHPVQAANPFKGGWTLMADDSSLTFQTIKNGSKLETSSFGSFKGSVTENGKAELIIQLDSVDTKVDLRNVRMRFLFFETFKYREATVSTLINPQDIDGLEIKGRLSIPLKFVLNLHGLSRELETSAIVTALTNGRVSVASASPISIATELFDLSEGVKKLEEAAGVTIVPMGSVAFNLVFATNLGDVADIAPEIRVTTASTEPVTTAIEPAEELNREQCAGRFEILSRTGAIYFRSGSAELDPASEAVLGTVIDLVERCASLNLTIAGHTDSAGSDDVNQWLSEERARAVHKYLSTNGAPMEKIRSTGFGETRPVAPNDTPRNRRLNRRIEFIIGE